MVLLYILYAFGFGYALRAAAETTAPLNPIAAWFFRIVLAALFPLFVAALAISALKTYLESRAKSPQGDKVELV